MFSSRYLVAPVLEAEQRTAKVYLPAGAMWTLWSKVSVSKGDIPKIYQGGNEVEVDCPIESMPDFYRMNSLSCDGQRISRDHDVCPSILQALPGFCTSSW